MNNPAPINHASIRLPFIDGLRAIAALWVVYGHIHLFTYGWNHHTSPLAYPLDILLYMHLGVNIFLVLSGFCLAFPVVRNGNRLKSGIKEYVKARALRILPPYYATLLIILAINFFVPLISWGRISVGLTQDIPAPVIWANVLLMQDFFPHLNLINGPFWSIATEWHLYFLFPLAVLLLRRFGITTLVILGSALALGLTWRGLSDPVMISHLQMTIPQPPYFIFLFLVGIAAAWFAYGENSQQRLKTWIRPLWIVTALLAIGFLALLSHYRITNGTDVHHFLGNLHWIDPLCGLLFAVLLVGLCALPGSHGAKRILENRALTKVGSFSYSLYLVHIPILATLNIALEHLLPQANVHWRFALLSLFGGALCLLISKVFADMFETPRWRTALGFDRTGVKSIDAMEIRLRLLEQEIQQLKLRIETTAEKKERIEKTGQPLSIG